MGFSRDILPRGRPAGEELTAAMAGIGMRFAARPDPEANIEDTLLFASDRARNEPRDLYDLWHLTAGGHVDLALLILDIEKNRAFRGRTRDAMTAELATKEARYKKLWAVRLGRQMATIPPFEEVFRAVRRSLRNAGLVEM